MIGRILFWLALAFALALTVPRARAGDVPPERYCKIYRLFASYATIGGEPFRIPKVERICAAADKRQQKNRSRK